MAHQSGYITPQLEKQLQEDGQPDFVIPKVEEQKRKVICPHDAYCRVRLFGRIKCLALNSVHNCQTYKFFEKYGKNYLQLGIGAQI